MSKEKPSETEKPAPNLSGHVYSKERALLNGAKVYCNGFETMTLADGSYRFTHLHPATYALRVTLKGFQPASTSISINDRDVTFDFHLSKAVGTARIHGHVYDVETRKPILTGGTVILILPITNRYTHIDDQGHYEFTDLPAGTYTLSTSITDYRDCDIDVTLMDAEVKDLDFFCYPSKEVEPAWG